MIEQPELIKGETSCNRTACQTPLSEHGRFWNTSTRKWYCKWCAHRINSACIQFGDPPLCFPEDSVANLPKGQGP